MDTLSPAVSIDAIIQPSSEAIKSTNSAAGATNERQSVQEELRACETISHQLKDEADNSGEGLARSETIKDLEAPQEPLSRLRAILRKIKAKLQLKEGLRKARVVTSCTQRNGYSSSPDRPQRQLPCTIQQAAHGREKVISVICRLTRLPAGSHRQNPSCIANSPPCNSKPDAYQVPVPPRDSGPPTIVSLPSSEIVSSIPDQPRIVSSTSRGGMQSGGIYEYQPLDVNSRQIRLLTLYTSPNPDSEIMCDLVHASLDAHPKYVAVSYVWGVPEPARFIRLGGALIKVRPNLFAALQRLRFSSEPLPRVLWIDALCINQDDLDERNSQVQLMGAIYSEAHYVHSWLGEESSDSKLAFKAIKLFAEAAGNDAKFDHLMQCLKSPEYDKHWKAIGHLLTREYWSRVWITQEVILSKYVLLVCGTDMCAWLTLVDMLTFLNPRSLPYLSDTAKGVFFALVDLPRSLSSMALGYESESLSLTKWLSIGRQRHATDIRDHVFAVLRLTPNDYRVDYKKTKGEIFREITKYAISLERNLDVLSCCGSFFSQGRRGLIPEDSTADTTASILANRAALYTTYDEAPAYLKAAFQWPEATHIVKDLPPSWVPDWGCPSDWGDLHSLVVNMRKECHFRAAGDSVPHVRYIDSQEKMLARGIWVDDITASHPDVEAGDREQFRKEWEFWQEDCNVPRRYGDNAANRLAFKITVALGRNLDGTKLCLNAEDFVDDEFLGLPQDGSMGDGGGRTHISREHCGDAILNSVPGRRFFLTRSGFIGRGPLGLRVGDVVAVLFGGKVPFILRQSERGCGHLMIGEAYIHGVMEGEILEELQGGSQEVQELTLI